MILVRALLVLLALVAGQAGLSAARGDAFEEAVAAFEAEDYARAEAQLRGLANKGHSGAETLMGVLYFRGLGRPADPAMAAIWFYKAARRGNPSAQLAFASLHIQGIGVAREPEKALSWLILARDYGPEPIADRATALLSRVAGEMPPAVLQAAQQEAEAFQPLQALERP